ncbi:MAG: hypothetical protein GX620_13225, partial [Chloroflexi bacterium]|nr:hypothetical protein [Chloroflexota bacterium]
LLTPEIYFQARATEVQANDVLDQEESAGYLPCSYALVIQPTGVTQVGFSATAYEDSVSTYYDDSFLVTGECLAVMPWPDVI